MKVLITGAAGFIGGALMRHLRAVGHSPVGADLVVDGEATVELDVRDRASVQRVLQTHHLDVVIHAAAIVDDRGDPALFEAVNVEGTQHMLEAAHEGGCKRFVQISSIAALGIDPGPDANANSPLVDNTGSPYFDTKARSEALARSWMGKTAMEVVVVRPGDVYGPGSVPWVERPLELMKKKQPVLVGGGKGLMTTCHIDNLVRGIELAATHADAAGGIFIVHDGFTTPYKDYFNRLATSAGLKPPRVSTPKSVARAVAGVAGLVHKLGGPPPPFTPSAVGYLTRQATYSIDEAKTRLGYEPTVGLDEGMRRLFQ